MTNRTIGELSEEDPSLVTESGTQDETPEPGQKEVLSLLPLRNIVFFPGQIMPLFVGRPSSVRLVEEAHQAQQSVLVLTQRDSSVDVPHSSDLYDVGTVVRIVKIYTMPDGSKSVVVQGIHLARFIGMVTEEPYLKAEIEVLPELEVNQEDVEITALVANVRSQLKILEGMLPDFNPEQLNLIMNTQEIGSFAHLVAALLNIPVPEKQELLETTRIQELLNTLIVALSKMIQRQELSQKIQADVQESVNKAQREFFLREQLRAIKKELGEENEQLEIDEMRRKLTEISMPDDIRAVVEKELNRLSVMSPAAAEYSVTRNYVDWLLDMPWMVSTEDNLDIKHVRERLDDDHYGLESVKKRVLEYLAVRKLKNDMRGPILCFVGPPGVGKTSLGRSIAEAMGRKYVRFSLGGVRDEAEIRGHRRTYIGALPGRIIQNIKKAGSNNPVLVLDEIDKVGMDFRGDPTSALLEVLDPEQNVNFSDHYLEVAFDLSRVLFIATANTIDTIQPALRDRMEIIEIPSYILEEKVHIARRHLLPKQLQEHGLTDTQLQFADGAIEDMIHRYTREAGVRNLERKLADVCRGAARQIAEGDCETVEVGGEDLSEYITSRKFFPDVAERITRPGIATGLAYTPVGGDILFIEATKMKGKGRLTITGQVRDVMKESVQAAMSYIAANAEQFGVDPDFRDTLDIHVHVPAAAIPKDGPSAGITMLSALTSLLTDQVLQNDLAMSGEITLRGQVLPVGGVKEKVLAAHRAGIKSVILPRRNEDDLEEIPASVREEITFHLVDEMHEVLDIALPKKRKATKSKKKSIAKDAEVS
ncbi:MAG: endopeptidase La [Bacteroidetes bacterium]|nr:endopeptidase La [Bacteroidota bacterium]